MKRALWLAGCCVLGGTSALVARGDNSASKPAPASASADVKVPTSSIGAQPVGALPSPIVAPSLVPDSIDLSTSDDPERIAEQTLAVAKQNRDNAPNPAVLEAVQQKQAEDHDWMLRGYREQLLKNGLEKAPAPDPYAVATIDPITHKLTDPLMDSLTQPPDIEKSVIRRTTDDEEASAPASTSLFSLPPMLPPVNAPVNPAAAPRDYFNTNPLSNLSADASTTAPVIPTDPSLGTSALDIPGMTAANDNMSARDLSLVDPLPDEPANSTRSVRSQNDFQLPVDPLNDSAAFFKKQQESLQAPNAPTFRALVTAPTVLPYVPEKPKKQPVTTGLRSHVADPFDILGR